MPTTTSGRGRLSGRSGACASGRAGERCKYTDEDHAAGGSYCRYGSGDHGRDSVMPSQCAGLVESSAPIQHFRLTDHYNSILVAPTGNAAVDAATPTLKLHRHSKF